MPDTPHFGWPFPKGEDGVDVPGDIDAAIQAIEDTLTEFDVAEIGSAGAGDSGKLLIVGAGGVPAWKAMSGNAAISNAGALTIGNAQVTTAMLVNQAVTQAKLALLSVGEGQLGEESVAAAKIKTFAVTAIKLAGEAVETAKIKNLAVTSVKIAEEAVTAAKLAAGSVGPTQLSTSAKNLFPQLVNAGATKFLQGTASIGWTGLSQFSQQFTVTHNLGTVPGVLLSVGIGPENHWVIANYLNLTTTKVDLGAFAPQGSPPGGASNITYLLFI